jgi:hypothetical protein
VIEEMKKIGDSVKVISNMKCFVAGARQAKNKVLMPNNYGDNPPLSYNKYLRVQDLINLQDCLSTPAHHDELLFITVHQAYELWFKQILHELDAAIRSSKKIACRLLRVL